MSAVPESRRRLRLTLLAVVALLLSALAIGVVAPVLWLAVDESAVPPASDAPALPEGITATEEAVSCASGGCWREWTLTGPPARSAAELAGSTGLSGEQCSARSLLDRRVVCAWVKVVDDDARLFLQYDRPWD